MNFFGTCHRLSIAVTTVQLKCSEQRRLVFSKTQRTPYLPSLAKPKAEV